jgi:hypothetical protein
MEIPGGSVNLNCMPEQSQIQSTFRKYALNSRILEVILRGASVQPWLNILATTELERRMYGNATVLHKS